MDTPIDLDKLTHQTQQREYLDGLRDLHLGMVILILSLLNWFVLSPAGATLLVKTVRYNKDLSIVGMIALLGLFILLLFGTERVMERIRRATLWKESGFVKPLRYGFNKWLILATTVIVLTIIAGSTWLMAMGTLSQETALRSIPAGSCLGTGVIFFGMGRSLKIQRYKFVGVAGVLLAIFLYFYPLSFALAWLYLGIGWTLILLASGIWALRLALLELKQGGAHE